MKNARMIINVIVRINAYNIKSGEELTIDYSTFDLDWKRKLKDIL